MGYNAEIDSVKSLIKATFRMNTSISAYSKLLFSREFAEEFNEFFRPKE